MRPAFWCEALCLQKMQPLLGQGDNNKVRRRLLKEHGDTQTTLTATRVTHLAARGGCTVREKGGELMEKGGKND